MTIGGGRSPVWLNTGSHSALLPDARIQSMFDTVCKFLIETFSVDFATWLLGKPTPLTELSPSELSLEPIRADALILLQSEDTILHVEFQSRPDPDMPFRMADYRLRGYRRFPDKAMHQVVIYLQPTQSQAVYQTTFEISGMRHEFNVLRLWEQPPSVFLGTPGLLPFAVLSQTQDPSAMLQQVATKISQLPDSRTQSNVAASAAILAGLLLDKSLIQRVLRKEMMQESVIYQEIRAEGRREGLQEGLEEGQQEGRRQEAVSMILRLLPRRVGPLDTQIQTQMTALSLAQIESLAEALFDFDGLADLSSWLEQLQNATVQILQVLEQQLGELLPGLKAEIQTLSLEQLASLETELTEWDGIDELDAWLNAQNSTNEVVS